MMTQSRTARRARFVAPALAALLFVAACNDETTAPPPQAGELQVNASSNTDFTYFSFADDGVVTHEHTFEQRAARTDERLVLDDQRSGAGRLEHATDRDAGRQVDARTDLGARPHEGVGIDHRAAANPGTDVQIGGRHDRDAGLEMHSRADRRSARHDAPARPTIRL